MLNGSARLVVRFDVVVRDENGSAVFDAEESRVETAGLDPAAASRLVSQMNGEQTLEDLATSCALRTGDVLAVAEGLVEAGMARQAGDPSSVIDTTAFTELARELYPQWKRRLFSHVLWRSLVDGSATFVQFAGWLVENYHFIEGVNDRLGSATAYAQNRRARRLFAKHYREEYDHGGFFLEALQNIGIRQTDVYASMPLPTTRAVLNHMRRCARTDSLQYAACSAFLESTGADRQNARGFFEAVAARYASNRPQIVAPLVAHLGLDEDYGHNGVLERICPLLGPITAARASAALEAARALVELLELWSSDIFTHYLDADALPRGKAYGRYRRPATTASTDPERVM